MVNDLDDPKTTQLRRHIIQDKPLLKNIYEEWYNALQTNYQMLKGRFWKSDQEPAF